MTTIFKYLLDAGGAISAVLIVALGIYIWMEFRSIRAQADRDRKAAEEAERRNEREHDRLHTAVEAVRGEVSALKATVEVLRDRSDRSGQILEDRIEAARPESQE